MKALKLSIALCLVYSSIGADTSYLHLEEYLSETKKKQYLYDNEKNEAESSVLKDSWIEPITLNYSYAKSNPYASVQVNENASIQIDQAIFRGGGIFYGVKFAHASQKYKRYSIDVAKRKMIKDAVATLMQIRQKELQIRKQELQVENATVNLALKKEQYLSGQLDSGFLDNAVIDRNVQIQSLYDIQTAQEGLISSFKILSDLEYAKAKIPHLKLLEEKEFLAHNLNIQVLQSQIQRDKENTGVIRAKYLPSIHLTAGYNWTKTDSQTGVFGSPQRDYYSYGFRASMPLDINTFRDIESAKISYYQSQERMIDTKKEQKSLYEKVMQSLKNLEKKKVLSMENMNLYEKLLVDTRELYRVGYKTEYDVQTLENSLKISSLDVEIYEMDRQLELLNLYEMYHEQQ